MAFAWLIVNHSASSGPTVIIEGMPPASGTGVSLSWPSTVRRPMRSPLSAVYQSAPSGPEVMP